MSHITLNTKKPNDIYKLFNENERSLIVHGNLNIEIQSDDAEKKFLDNIKEKSKSHPDIQVRIDPHRGTDNVLYCQNGNIEDSQTLLKKQKMPEYDYITYFFCINYKDNQDENIFNTLNETIDYIYEKSDEWKDSDNVEIHKVYTVKEPFWGSNQDDIVEGKLIYKRKGEDLLKEKTCHHSLFSYDFFDKDSGFVYHDDVYGAVDTISGAIEYIEHSIEKKYPEKTGGYYNLWDTYFDKYNAVISEEFILQNDIKDKQREKEGSKSDKNLDDEALEETEELE